MAVKKLKKDELVKLLGVKLTDEQSKSIADEFELEFDDMTFEEVKKKYVKELGELKEKVVKERFKNKPEAKKDKEIDIEKIKQEAREEAVRATKIGSFINNLKEDDREDAEALIKSKLAKEVKLDDAIKQVSTRFIKQNKKVEISDFGTPTKKVEVDGKEVDEIAAELDKYI